MYFFYIIYKISRILRIFTRIYVNCSYGYLKLSHLLQKFSLILSWLVSICMAMLHPNPIIKPNFVIFSSTLQDSSIISNYYQSILLTTSAFVIISIYIIIPFQDEILENNLMVLIFATVNIKMLIEYVPYSISGMNK